MKRAIPWLLLAVAVFAIFLITRGHDGQVADIMDQSIADVKAAKSVANGLMESLAESDRLTAELERRYAGEREKVERLEAVLKKKERVAANQATLPSSPSPFVIDWQSIYNHYFDLNQGYIADNESLRLKHDALIKEHEAKTQASKALDLQRVSVIEGLTLARNRLAALHRPRWVVVFGVGATYGEDKKLHTGLQITAGIRIDDLFRRKKP